MTDLEMIAEDTAALIDALDDAMNSAALAIAAVRSGDTDDAVAILNRSIDTLLEIGVTVDPAPRVNAWDVPLSPHPTDLER